MIWAVFDQLKTHSEGTECLSFLPYTVSWPWLGATAFCRFTERNTPQWHVFIFSALSSWKKKDPAKSKSVTIRWTEAWRSLLCVIPTLLLGPSPTTVAVISEGVWRYFPGMFTDGISRLLLFPFSETIPMISFFTGAKCVRGLCNR